MNVQCRSDENGEKASIIRYVDACRILVIERLRHCSDIGSVFFDDSIMERVLLPALTWITFTVETSAF